MSTEESAENVKADVEAVNRIPIIAQLLDVVCRTTGMGFAALARVTETQWITCSVLDTINFGIKVGDVLDPATTLCNEMRLRSEALAIDHVEKSEAFADHPTPKIYGFQSYVSVAIWRKDGSFFGTLCALDPRPAHVNTPEILGMFQLFADLISFHLDAVKQMEQNDATLLKEREEHIKAVEKKNEELQKMNIELESFAYIASHDLQEPLRKINTFSNRILEKDYELLSADGREYFKRMGKSVKRMERLISDLFKYTKIGSGDHVFENKNIAEIVGELKREIEEDLNLHHATIEIGTLCTAFVIHFQFYQLLQNLVGNSIKFSRPGINPVIQISATSEFGNSALSERLSPEKSYCHIVIADNGIGFEPQYSDKIFKVFQRLHGREEYEGTGIGLSIVKKIVDNHNGHITATGVIDQGATFDIYIPQP